MDTIRTSGQLVHYDGLYGDIRHKPHASYMFLEAIETRSKGFDWIIDPHVHAHLYQLFLIESGSVTFTGTSRERLLQAPCMLFVPPSTLHGLHYSKDVKGQILTLSDHTFEKLFSPSSPALTVLERLHVISFSEENAGNFHEAVQLIHKVGQELFSDFAEKQPMLDALFTQLFLIIFRMGHSASGQFTGQNPLLDYFVRFQKLIKNEDQVRSIPDLARELGITPAHLNRICRKVCGQSTLTLVHQALMQKAQNYLAHTSYSVSEIAYLLHFEYQNHFARVFKKITGLSPLDYRKAMR